MNHRDSFASLFQLPNEDRIQLAQDLWQSVSPAQGESPVAEWVLSKLRERKELFDANPNSGLTWDEVLRSSDDIK